MSPRRPFLAVFRATPTALLLLGAGCYPTTPHRAVATAAAAPARCTEAIDRVFARSGFVELPAPPQVWRFFGPRTGGPYNSFLRTGTGVGVTLDPVAEKTGTCHLTIEAFSLDSASLDLTPTMPGGCMDPNQLYGPIMTPIAPVARLAPEPSGPCPLLPQALSVTSAPGPDTDAAVDELARRLQAELGPRARVN